MPTADVINPEVMEVQVRGPDGANRMFVCTGQAEVSMSVSGQAETQTWRFLIGPELTRSQFIRASAMASISNVRLQVLAGATSDTDHNWGINFLDADWDDGSGQVEVSVELNITADQMSFVALSGLIYHVVIIAQIT